MTVKKLIGYLHRWLGLASGLVVFVVSLTGAMLTFEEEIEHYLISPDLFFVDTPAKPPLPVDRLMNIATPELLKLKHGNSATRIFLYKDPNRSVIVGYNRADDTLVKWPYTRGHVFLNPYTGAVLGSRSGNPHHAVWSVITDIHINLFLGTFGNYLVTWGTLIFLVMVVSGLVLWWPRNKAALKQRYKFSWKDTTRWRRKNYDLHNVLGFYACWVVIFMIITGLMWSFEWFNKGVYYLTSGGQQLTIQDVGSSKPNSAGKTYPLALSDYVRANEALHQKYPTATEYSIGYFASEKDSILDVSANIDPSGLIASRNVWGGYGKTTGRMTKDNWETATNMGDALQYSTNELHYGTLFGLTGKIATFLACLIAISLPVTGFYIWWGRRKKDFF